MCSQHPAYSQPADHQLPLPQTRTPAEVRSSHFVFILMLHVRYTFQPLIFLVRQFIHVLKDRAMMQTSSAQTPPPLLFSLNLRYLSELCCVDGPSGAGKATFPVVSALLSAKCNLSLIMTVFNLPRDVSPVPCGLSSGG